MTTGSTKQTGRQAFHDAKKALAEKDIPKGRTAEVPTKKGGKYTYNYADLGDILNIVDPILHKNGLHLAHPIGRDDYGPYVEACVRHSGSDETVEHARIYLSDTNGDPQALGSLLTYYKRYATCAVLGIHPEDDDDGHAAKEHAEGRQQAGGEGGGEQKQEGHYQGYITHIDEDRRDNFTIFKVHTQTANGKAGSISTTDSRAGEQARQYAGTGEEVVIHWFRNKKGYPALKAVEPIEAAPSEPGPSQEDIEEQAEMAF